MNRKGLDRRDFVRNAARLAGASLLPLPAFRSLAAATGGEPILRTIPAGGETIPVAGMGSARTFDIDPDDRSAMDTLRAVLKAFYDGGGRVIDTSPMYGNAETVLGKLMAELGLTEKFWIATKVWTHGREDGIAQMERSMARLGRKKLELIQVHNLKDTGTHLETLREWKKTGRIRYLGATHYREDRHDELVRLLEREPLDFLQFNYNLRERNAEKRLLPACREKGVATLINEPFNKGALFRLVKDKPVPDWAATIDCRSWAQLFLKYLIGHPAVTAVIPATSDPGHAADNVAAGHGAVPDEKMRERILHAVMA